MAEIEYGIVVLLPMLWGCLHNRIWWLLHPGPDLVYGLWFQLWDLIAYDYILIVLKGRLCMCMIIDLMSDIHPTFSVISTYVLTGFLHNTVLHFMSLLHYTRQRHYSCKQVRWYTVLFALLLLYFHGKLTWKADCITICVLGHPSPWHKLRKFVVSLHFPLSPNANQTLST